MSKHTFRSLISRSEALQAVLRPAALRRSAPRRGQALLLAVLLMVFAALIGSTFITVVALNMDQTSAQQERVAAANSARNGLDTVNYQLVSNGIDWRPEHISPPPDPFDAAYNFYYTPQEIAAGFARTSLANISDLNGDTVVDAEDEWIYLENEKNAGRPVFVKFPDPRNAAVTNAPTYLAEVRIASTGADPDKQGMLRLTVVGTSPNDPKVLVPRVAYKGTSEKGGAFAWDLFHTNWDYAKNAPVRTEWQLGGPTAAGATTITVQDASGIAPGRTIVLQQGSVYEAVMATSISGNTITLKTPTTQAYTAGDVSVRAGTSVMNDLIGNENYGTLTTQFSADAERRDTAGAPCAEEGCATYEATATQFRPLPYGALFNTDLEFVGKSTFSLLPNSVIKTAGLIYAPAAESRPRMETAGTEEVTPTSTGTPQVHTGALTPLQKLIYDNIDVTGNESSITDPNRGTQHQAPPSLDTFARLQNMTKYTSGAAIGLGDGIYINNAEDKEKVLENGSLRELTTADLHRLMTRKSFPALADGNADVAAGTGDIPAGTALHRLCYPRLIVRGNSSLTDAYSYPINNPLLSLEQRGIRGWINEQEFVPRGALVELSGNQIAITLDDRSDGGTLPDPAKAWGYATANTSAKCYRMVIDTSNPLDTRRFFGMQGALLPVGGVPSGKFNGVIYAEGNIRVRGTAGNRDITIVSMNNIYVEGNLRRAGATAGRIALLAKKNVVLNPTQFVTRVQGTQDSDIGSHEPIPVAISATNTGTGADNTTNLLQVTTVQPFRVNDVIRISGTNHSVAEVVTAPTAGLVINPPLGAPITSTPITIRDVAAMVSSVAGVAVVVNSIDPFRVGDRVRFGSAPGWFRIDNINSTTNTLTLDAAPVAVADDSIELMIVPNIVASNNPPEYRYAFGGRRPFARDAQMDGVTVAAGSGGYFRTPVRVAGTMRKAYLLTLEPTIKNGGAAVNTPFTTPLTVTASDDTSADKLLQPGEWRLISTDPNGATAPKNYDFNYDLVSAANQMLDDPASTPATPLGLLNVFNATEQYPEPLPTPTTVYKWELTLPTGGGAMSTAQAQTIPSRCLMSGGLPVTPAATTAASNPWNPAPKDADASWQLWLTSSGSLEWRGAPAAGLAIGSPLLATDNADLETMQPDFYFTGSSGTPAQQWMRWLDRAAGTTINANSNIIRLVNNNLNMAPLPPSQLPPLRVSGVKLERDDFVQTTGTRSYDAVPVSVEATVFAQEGSWFVIPMPNLNRTDIDHDTATPLTTADIANTTRMRRLNYDVQFTGRIIQNYAPTALYDYDAEDTPDATEAAPSAYNGAMAQWIDAMAHPTQVEAATATQGRGRDWQSIVYNADATPVPANTQLMLPPSPDVTIVN